jgi:hypothetical protein
MTQPAEVRVTTAPSPVTHGRWLLRRVCTNNPFYVLSAGLFLVGLWGSFGAQQEAQDTWALMAGLADYTLLLALTAWLLVRFANVWDDVRTVLLLVVLMFLATSVTFDEVLVLDPLRGFACYLGGLFLAVAVSEGLLRGMRLKLPAWYRAPYYLILSLFFLYPLALSPLVTQPGSEALMWGLFGFSTAAGLAFLTLLPAVRRGPAYVRDNGSPWPWPLYPWVLFGLLGAAVPARAFLLCWSMHLLSAGQRDQLIFGPYFLVPLGLALNVLLLEAGMVSKSRRVVKAALVAPACLVLLAAMGHRPDAIYRSFLGVFADRLGGSPLWLTLLASALFYAYAALRRVPRATPALALALLALAFVGPQTATLGELAGPRPGPLLAAAALPLAWGFRRRHCGYCLLGALGLAAAAGLALPQEVAAWRGPAALHLALAAVLVVGAAFNDPPGHFLRLVGAGLVLSAGLVATFGNFEALAAAPPWARLCYPPTLAVLAAAYGLALGHRPSLVAAGLLLVCWLAGAGWQGYRSLRAVVWGLDYIALSLALFALAFLISLGKAGILSRRIGARWAHAAWVADLEKAIDARAEQRICRAAEVTPPADSRP